MDAIRYDQDTKEGKSYLMRLGGMFGKQPLAKAPRAAVPKNEEQPLAPIPNAPPARTSSLAASFSKKRPGPIPVTYPKVAPQQVKDYRAILTEEDLVAYCSWCQGTGFASFDWETAASREARERWQTWRADWQQRKDICVNVDEFKALEAEYKAAYKAYLETPLDPHQGDICTVSIAGAPHEARVIPISNREGDVFEPSLTRDAARELVMKIIGRMIFNKPDVLKIAVNLSFETKFAAKYRRYILGRVADPLNMWVRCMQVSSPDRIKNPKRPYTGWGLKPMTEFVYGVKMMDFKALLEKHNAEFFDEIDASRGDGLNYSAEDADYGLQLYHYWNEVAKQIPGYEKWLHEVEMPFGRVIGLMEYHGMRWDGDLASVKRQEAEIEMEKLHGELRQIAHDTFGIDLDTGGKAGRNNAVKDFVFKYLQLPVVKLTDAKQPSLDEEAVIDMEFVLNNNLENLKKEEPMLQFELPEGWETMTEEELQRLPATVEAHARIKRRPPHPYREVGLRVLAIMRRMQKYSTLLSSHIDGREKWLNPVTGRIHAQYGPWTETSRLSSYNPNGQNVPRLENDELGVRMFYIPGVGKILFFIDFSGFELRIMAWRANDGVMIEIFRTGGDMHRKTAAEMTGKAEEDVTKTERTDAKPANFGIAYGGGEYSLQNTYKTQYKMRKTLAECADQVAAVKRAYPGIPVYQEEIIDQAKEDGYVTTALGYIRLLPDINSANNYLRGSAGRQAGNTPIQGSAADFMKVAQNEVYEEIGRGTYLQEADPGAQVLMCHGVTDMLGQVHDEIIFELDDDPGVVQRVHDYVKAVMERPPLPDFPVPIEAEGSVGYAWGKKMSIKDWVASRNG